MMFKVIQAIVYSVFYLTIRNFYWLYRLLNIEFQSVPKIIFPIIVEGKGSIKFGSQAKLAKGVNIGCAKNAKLRFGNKVILQEAVSIKLGETADVTFGDDITLGEKTKAFTNSIWQIGDRVIIASNCSIFAREPGVNGRLIIGDGTYIGDGAIIDVCADVVIGKEVAIGPNCIIYSHDHNYTNGLVPAWKGGIIRKSVVIGQGSWIGANVVILPGIKIGVRCVIAAGAIVTKDIPDNVLALGIPAKPIKKLLA